MSEGSDICVTAVDFLNFLHKLPHNKTKFPLVFEKDSFPSPEGCWRLLLPHVQECLLDRLGYGWDEAPVVIHALGHNCPSASPGAA